MGNVVIGFIGVSDFGNNAWIDNVIVSAPNSLCTDAVTGPGTYNCNSIVSLNFTATPVPPLNGNQSTSGVKKSEKAVIESTNNIPFYSGEAVINAFTQNDNPNGGTAFVSQYTNNDPGQSIAPNVGNGDATTPNGSIFDPSNVYHDFWFTITYDGNDYQGYATYDISIDITGSGFTIPNELYIVKRTDRTGAWVCQNTTIAGNILTVTGLTDFSDFALAGQEALPVELSSFVSSISGNSVTLNWTTSSEINNSGFDIERSSVSGVWSKVGSVSGNGTSATPNSYSFTERNVASGNYSYRLKQTDFNGNFEYFNLSSEVVIGIPTEFKLSQNYPNPFNPSTTINYEIPVDGAVSLKIFDMSGKEVMTLVDGVKNAGYYSINFNASNLSSGIYFYKLSANDFTSVKKMMLVK
ncbi:MAG: T9SS type A sorting domain-containing protein [Ignavibacteria bacterium]|nr:T9SS type A sorting domain-containing protein [Ignavibacteria bacterium]